MENTILNPVELAEKGDLEALEEGGKYEVIELKLKYKKEVIRLVCRADFDLLKKAMNSMMNMDISGDKNVSASLDIFGAGDKILFFGGLLNKEEVLSKASLRMKACSKLGEWVQDLMDFEDEEIEEKKS